MREQDRAKGLFYSVRHKRDSGTSTRKEHMNNVQLQ